MPNSAANNSGSANDHAKDDELSKTKPGQGNREGQEYAAEMWGNIRKKSSQNQREELRDDVQDVKSINPFENSTPMPESIEPADEGAQVEVEPVNPFNESGRDESVALVEAKIRPREEKTESVEGGHEAQEENTGTSMSSVDGDASLPEKYQSEGFSEENIWDVLAQAGFTKRKMLIFGIILLLFIFVFVYFLFFGNLFGSSKTNVSEQTVKESVVNQRPVENIEVVKGELPLPSLVSNYQFGLEANPDFPIQVTPLGQIASDASFRAAFLFGFNDILNQALFVDYMDLLRKMQNIYNTDVYALLDRSADRSGELRKHLEEMQGIINDGVAAVNYLDKQLTVWDAQLKTINSENQDLENLFFESANSLLGKQAYSYFEEFVDLSQNEVEVKALNNAYMNVRAMLVNSLNALNPRYHDIDVNFEALVRGVRVFEVPNSNINAIIRLEN